MSTDSGKGWNIIPGDWTRLRQVIQRLARLVVPRIEKDLGSVNNRINTLFAENIDLTGAIRGGKESFAAETPGFWMGKDGEIYRFKIGGPDNGFAFTGTQSSFKGSVTIVGAGGVAMEFVQGAPPTSLHSGDRWLDTSTAVWYVAHCVGANEIKVGEWETLKGEKGDEGEKGEKGDTGAAGAPGPSLTRCLWDQRTSYQTTGRIIVVTDKNNRAYQYDGSSWNQLDADGGQTHRVRLLPDDGSGIGLAVQTWDSEHSTHVNTFVTYVSGANVGDLVIGDYAGGKGIKWDQSAQTMDVQGDITCHTLTAHKVVTLGEIADDNGSQVVADTSGYLELIGKRKWGSPGAYTYAEVVHDEFGLHGYQRSNEWPNRSPSFLVFDISFYEGRFISLYGGMPPGLNTGSAQFKAEISSGRFGKHASKGLYYNADGEVTVPGACVNGALAGASLPWANLTGAKTGTAQVKTLDGASLKNLLTGSTNGLFAVNAGDQLLLAGMEVYTASGLAVYIQIGVDSNIWPSGADADGLAVNINSNLVGVYGVGAAGANLGGKCGVCAAAAGYVTVTTNASIAGTGFSGKAWLLYLPA